MTKMDHVLLSEMLQWYRLQRHDAMNHWQVIMGNLQLKQPDKALAYMRETVMGFEQEQKIGQIPQSRVSAVLLGLLIRLDQEGVKSTIDFPEGMKREDFWQDHWREEYVDALYGYTRECMTVALQSKDQDNVTAEVYLFEEPGGFACQVILSNEEAVLFDKIIRLL